MSFQFCTITTASHLAQVCVLFESLQQLHPDCQLDVLVADAEQVAAKFKLNGINYHPQSILLNAPFLDFYKKYKKKSDALRWSLKPVFTAWLIRQNQLQQIFYLDNDLYFVGDYQFLAEELHSKQILLCPHWRIKSPNISREWFIVNFTDGVYNAGFFGASKAGLEILDWWAEACLFRCTQDKRSGLWDDQKYLDLVPAAFENVGILQHRGCNVAFWNIEENKTTLVSHQLLINERWPIVFLHITKKLVDTINNDKEKLLRPFLDSYRLALKKYQ